MIGYEIVPVDGGPLTLISQYEDKGQDIRVKDTTEKNFYSGVFRDSDTVIAAMMAIFETFRFHKILSIITFDPKTADPATHEMQVRFFRPKATVRYIAPDQCEVRWTFRDI